MTFSNAFSWIKMFKFRIHFDWSLFQLTIFQHWLRKLLGADQATSQYPSQWWLIYWLISSSLGFNKLSVAEVACVCRYDVSSSAVINAAKQWAALFRHTLFGNEWNSVSDTCCKPFPWLARITLSAWRFFALCDIRLDIPIRHGYCVFRVVLPTL